MAKKKATMTLKDFHGGSIPSDLPLPSAPGVIARPLNHVGFDRQSSSWGNNPMGRSDHRLRPGSAGSVRNFDDKTLFLSQTAQIGRNFDEDERKPLDGGSAPRRTISDESIRGGGGGGGTLEVKLDYRPAGNVTARPATTPVSQFSTGVNQQNFGGGSYSRSEGRVLGVNNSNQNVSGGPGVAGSSPNAWGLRKEPVVVMEPVAASWSAPDAVSKLAHASALEKVSSGRWHSKQQSQVDVEVIRHPEMETEEDIKGGVYDKYGYNSMNVIGGREYHDAALSRHADRILAIDDRTRVGARELPAYERSRSPLQSEIVERKIPIDVDGFPHQTSRNYGVIGGTEMQRLVSSEPSERPKLKLLPRSKPVDNLEPPVGYKQPSPQSSDPGHPNTGREAYGHGGSAFHGLDGSESGKAAVERPKLNLRPRLQASEPLEGSTERGRSNLFGGSRPRELVLKERGVDDIAVINNLDLVHSPNRIKQDSPRPETLPFHATSARQNGKVDNVPLDHRIGKHNERRDHRVDVEKTERRNWRNNDNNNNRKNGREAEKQQQPQERPPSPETWRKPIEQPPSPGQHFGKATSAVDLAQAFSRSVSDPKIANQFPAQRSLPNPGQIPFSRLTGPTPRRQLNGY